MTYAINIYIEIYLIVVGLVENLKKGRISIYFQ